MTETPIDKAIANLEYIRDHQPIFIHKMMNWGYNQALKDIHTMLIAYQIDPDLEFNPKNPPEVEL